MKLRTIQNTQNKQDNDEMQIKMEVDKILDKLNEQGWESLTSQEEEFLTSASKRLFDERPAN